MRKDNESIEVGADPTGVDPETGCPAIKGEPLDGPEMGKGPHRTAYKVHGAIPRFLGYDPPASETLPQRLLAK